MAQKDKFYVATKDWFNGMEYIKQGKPFKYDGEPAKWMHESDSKGNLVSGKSLEEVTEEESETLKKEKADEAKAAKAKK